MKFPYVLCIIDMQYKFKAAHDEPTIQANLDKIKQAITDQAYIIIVQFRANGKTLKPLRDAVQGYPWKKYCYACKSDKSGAITSVIFNENICVQVMYVTGVNTEACVLTTVSALSHRHPEKCIYVHQDACNSTDEWWHKWGFQQMLLSANVRTLQS